MATAYKLATKDLTTYNGYQWVMGEWRETNGKGDLCGNGWLHAYATPSIAAFHNPMHANMNLEDCVLLEMECEGKFKDDRGLKCGYSRMRPVQEIPLVIPTSEQRVRYAIYCAVWIYKDEKFIEWARKWLSGEDRAEAAAAAWAEYPWEEFAFAALKDTIPVSLTAILSYEGAK
jgi:hypothetical protein